MVDQNANINIGANTQSFQEGVEGAGKQVSVFQRTLESTKTAFKDLPDRFDRFKKSVVEFSKTQQELAKAQIEAIKKAQEETGAIQKTLDKTRERFSKYKDEVQSFVKTQREYIKVQIDAAKQTEQYQKATIKLQESFQGVRKYAEELNKSLQGKAPELYRKSVEGFSSAYKRAKDGITGLIGQQEKSNKLIQETVAETVKADNAFIKFFKSAGSGLEAFGWLANTIQGLVIANTAVQGLSRSLDALSGLDRIPQLFALMESLGVSSGPIQQFGLLADAIKGNQAALDQFALSANNAFAQFESGLTVVNTIYKQGKEVLEGYGKQVQDLVNGPLKNMVSSVQALSGAYEVMSGGFTKAADSQRVLEAGLKLTTVGYGNSSDTLRLLVKTMRAYGFESGRAAQTAAELNGIVEQGITTIPELSQNFGQVASVASQAGLKIQELSAATAVLTAKGTTTSSALTGIEALLRVIINKTPEAEKALAELSATSGKALKLDVQSLREKGLVSLLEELNEAAKGNVSVLADIIPESLAYSTALQLMAGNVESFKNATTALGDATSESFNKIFDTVAEDRTKRFEALSNRFQEFLIEFGKTLTPLFEGALKTIETFGNAINAIPEPIKNMIGQFLILQVTTNQLSKAMFNLIGTFFDVTKAIVGFRAFNLLFNGQLVNQIKIIKDLALVQKDYFGVLRELYFGTLLEQQIKQKSMATDAAKAATAATVTTAKKAETVATAENVAASQASVVATVAEGEAKVGLLATLKAKAIATYTEAKATLFGATTTVAETVAVQAETAATVENTIVTGANTTAQYFNIGALAAKTKAYFTSAGASRIFLLAQRGVELALKGVAIAAQVASKAFLFLFGNPVILAGLAAVAAAGALIYENFFGATAQIRAHTKSLDELIETSAKVEDPQTRMTKRFQEMASAIKRTNQETLGFNKTLQDLEQTVVSGLSKTLDANEEIVQKAVDRYKSIGGFANSLSPAGMASKVATGDVGGPLESFGQATAAIGTGLADAWNSAMDRAFRDPAFAEAQKKYQAISNAILGIGEDGSLSEDPSSGTFGAVASLKKGRGISDALNQAIDQGRGITADTLEKEKKAYEEIRGPLDAYVASRQKELEQEKNPERRAAIVKDIKDMQQYADSLKEAHDQAERFLQTRIAIDSILKQNNKGFGFSLRDSLKNQISYTNEQLNGLFQQAQSGTLENYGDLTNAVASSSEQISQAFEQGISGFTSGADAAEKVRQLRDRTITREDGTTGSPLDPKTRQALTDQIIQLQNKESENRVANLQREGESFKALQSLQLMSAKESGDKIAAIQLNESKEKLTQIETQIDEYRRAGYRTVELEKQAAQARESIRLQEATNLADSFKRTTEERITELNRESELVQAQQKANVVGAREAEDQLAGIQQQEAQARLAELENRIKVYQEKGYDTVELEKEAAQARQLIRLSEAAEIERLFKRELERRGQLIENQAKQDIQSVQSALNQIQIESGSLGLDKAALQSQQQVAQAIASQQESQIQRQQQLTTDVQKQAELELELAKTRQANLAQNQAAERSSLAIDIQQNKLTAEREVIQSRIAIIENEAAQRKLELELILARREKRSQEELDAIELQLSASKEQKNLLVEQAQQTERAAQQQETIAQNSQEELAIRQQIAAQGGILDVTQAKEKLIAAEVEQRNRSRIETAELAAQQELLINDLISKGMAAQQRAIDLRKQGMDSIRSYVEGEAQILQETTRSTKERKKVAEELARFQLNMLLKTQAIERQNLEIQIQQQKIALDRQKIENQTARIKNEAEVATAAAEAERVRARYERGEATAREVSAADKSLQAKVSEGAGLAYTSLLIDQQGQIESISANQQRSGLRLSQDLQRDQARLNLANNLRSRGAARTLKRQVAANARNTLFNRDGDFATNFRTPQLPELNLPDPQQFVQQYQTQTMNRMPEFTGPGLTEVPQLVQSIKSLDDTLRGIQNPTDGSKAGVTSTGQVVNIDRIEFNMTFEGSENQSTGDSARQGAQEGLRAILEEAARRK